MQKKKSSGVKLTSEAGHFSNSMEIFTGKVFYVSSTPHTLKH